MIGPGTNECRGHADVEPGAVALADGGSHRSRQDGTDRQLRLRVDVFARGARGLPPLLNGGPPPVDPNAPTIFTALQEQLGLKLDSQRGPVDVVVIDRVEQPVAD